MSAKNNVQTNPLLTNGSLENLINSLVVKKEQKSALLQKLPQLDEAERQKMFYTLREVFLLDMEGEEAIERLRKMSAT